MATTLVGNNVANYVTSLAIVLIVRQLYANDGGLAEMSATLLMAPFLFTLLWLHYADAFELRDT